MALRKLSTKHRQKKAGKVGSAHKYIRASLAIRAQNPIGDIGSRARALAGRFLANFYQAADFCALFIIGKVLKRKTENVYIFQIEIQKTRSTLHHEKPYEPLIQPS